MQQATQPPQKRMRRRVEALLGHLGIRHQSRIGNVFFQNQTTTLTDEFCQCPNKGTTSQSLREAMQGRSKKVDSHGREVAGVQQVRVPAAVQGQPAAILVGRSLVLGDLEEHMAIKRGWQFRQVWHNCRIVCHSLQN